MKRIFVSMLFIAGVFNNTRAQIEQGSFVSRPKEIDDVLNNPGIGFTTFQRFNGDTLTTLDNNLRWTEGYPIVYQSYKGTLQNKNHPATSIAYWRVYWKFLEPEKGKYRWDMIDSALQTARQRKQTLMLRVAPYGSLKAAGDVTDVPKWYREIVGNSIDWKHNSPVNRWVVDANDPRYAEYFGGFIRELGKRYDGHPALEAVDLSIVGAWGEGGGSALLSEQARAELVHAYTDNFRKTPLLALITDAVTNKLANESANVGWRVDCIGDLGFWAKDQNGRTHMYDYYPQSIVRNGLEDAWKKAPVSLEICGTLYRWKTQEKYTTEQVKYIFDQTLKWHISSFNAKSSPVPPEWEPLVNEWLKKMGYRFVLRKFSCMSVVKRNEKVDIETWWENKGVDPCYKSFKFAIRLKNASDSATFMMDADVRKWLPGDIIYDNSIYIPSDLNAGQYELQVAIVDDVTNKPAVQLAIEGKQRDGWYALGKIKVQQ
jgi:hypothetical protein